MEYYFVGLTVWAQLFEEVDTAVHWTNFYPVDYAIAFTNTK